VTNKSTDPHDAAIKLKESYRVLLTCHRNPDGDAIGSELAIAELAEKIGVDAVIVNRDATPANLRMLPGADRVVVGDPGRTESWLAMTSRRTFRRSTTL
jgi:nanoRNase/pAp phosphatase (c-di-AMP/oligoRNAs hydrolase)